MRRLHQKVNLIPVIAKADTLTEEEVSLFKQRVGSPSSVVDMVLMADPRRYPPSRYSNL
jgi:septin 7